jgi:two-component system response regulator AtoC
LPPLRNRKSDIPELAKQFFDMAKQKGGKSSLRLTKGEMDKLAEAAFDWPGNIRQLEKALLNAVLYHESGRDLTAAEILDAARQVERLT